MRRNTELAAAALAGAAVATLLGRRLRPGAPTRESADPRALELRRKLGEARMAPPDEDDFEVAGMGAETIVEVERRAPAPEPAEPAAAPERPPSDEFEAMRRRVHEEARAAAEEMRRDPER